MQKLNLVTELKNLKKYLLGRLADYSVYINAGPGEDEDQILLIAAGFEIEQSGWFSLVFDTRPRARNDGEWTLWVEDNKLECPSWVINTPTVSIKTIDPPMGFHEVPASPEYIALELGEMIASLLDEFNWRKLPVAEGCQIIIEEANGHFERRLS